MDDSLLLGYAILFSTLALVAYLSLFVAGFIDNEF